MCISMLKALLTLLPQEACVVLYKYTLFLNLNSWVYIPISMISCRLYALRVLSSTIQADLKPGT